MWSLTFPGTSDIQMSPSSRAKPSYVDAIQPRRRDQNPPTHPYKAVRSVAFRRLPRCPSLIKRHCGQATGGYRQLRSQSKSFKNPTHPPLAAAFLAVFAPRRFSSEQLQTAPQSQRGTQFYLVCKRGETAPRDPPGSLRCLPLPSACP